MRQRDRNPVNPLHLSLSDKQLTETIAEALIDDPSDTIGRMSWLTETRRAYIYRVVLALWAVLIAVGVVDDSISTEVLGAIAAVLGVGATGLATANTSTHPDDI